MPLKLLLILSLCLSLVSCGGNTGRRHRVGTAKGLQLQGLSADDLSSFNRLIQTLNIDKLTKLPKNNDRIQYLATYQEKQKISFKLEDEGPFKGELCHYEYQKILIDEILEVNTEGKLIKSKMTTVPQEAVFLDIPGPFKKQCDKEADTAFSAIRDIDVDLPTRLVNFKASLLTNFSTLIEVCRSRKELKDGRCLELKIQELKKERARNFSGSRFIFESSIRTSKGTRDYKSVFSLDFAHFYFGGMIYQEGESGVLANGESRLSKLEVLCLNDSCP